MGVWRACRFVSGDRQDVPNEKALAEVEGEVAQPESGRAGIDSEAAHVRTESRVEPVFVPELVDRQECAGERWYVPNIAEGDAVTTRLAISGVDAEVPDQVCSVLDSLCIDKNVSALTQVGEVFAIGVSMEGTTAVDNRRDGSNGAAGAVYAGRQCGVSTGEEGKAT